MGIKEKDLQTIEQLSDGDKLRVVTSDGDSRNVPASIVGGTLVVNIIESNGVFITDKTFGEIRQSFFNGNTVIFNEERDNGGKGYIALQIYYSITTGDDPYAEASVSTQSYTLDAEISGMTEYTLDALDECYLYYS